MGQLRSISEYKALHDRLNAVRNKKTPTIIISAGTCGQASGANDLIRVTKREILARGLANKINLRITGCHGFCEMEPSVLIEPHGIFYPEVGLEDMVRVVDAVSREAVLEDLPFKDPQTGQPVIKQSDIPFYKKQLRLILSRNEKVDPIRIFNYIEVDGYQAFVKVLARGDRDWVVDQAKTSVLRGRGGAGFPTGLKWEFLAKQNGNGDKYLVCNADEGDPGAYMDRSVLEGNPHSIIEGMLIGAYGTGATEGVIYVRNEYPLAIKHLIIALRQAREQGLLGANILGTDFSFDIRIVKGAGAFVCGEETALIHSIEGKVGEPRQRPPYPVQKGINGRPTAINNVETWANIPVIFEMGAAEFAKIGTKNNSGTKIFSLVGKVKYTGLVEVPMGTTIETIVNDIGGGPSGNAKIKAVQTGGPSGGCIPSSMFNLPIDYDSLTKAGSIMGSGGMIVMDDNTCMLDIAKYYMNFLKDESCGKCFTCRKGTQRMHEILDDITSGKASMAHIDLLAELAEVVKDTTMCGLGNTASNSVLSTLKYFRNEYEKHIWDQRCDAFVCKEIVGAPCQSACPIGTEAWRYVAHIAHGEYEQAYQVIRESNPFPSVCARVCDHKCESRCKLGTTGMSPVAIRALKRFVTDTIDPMSFKPERMSPNGNGEKPIAIIGSGPSGLTAAHYLSLKGYKVTVFESESIPGGMLTCGIPSYRLPRAILDKEIESLIDENVTVQCNTKLGRDITIDELFNQGFKSVFLAMGAHKSRKLNIEGEDIEGVYPAIQFLKDFNLRGEKIAKGRVGVIGGGDSAVDAARVALRQPAVESVTILYRRTRVEMPALATEVDAAIDEGIKLETLVTPLKIRSRKGKLSGVDCLRNKLGDMDASGRRNPVPIPGSEFTAEFDTLVVTIGDVPDIEFIENMGIEITQKGTVKFDSDTLVTSRAGVFAGGDVVTGPNTVVKAIAAGKKAAEMIDRYLHDQEVKQPSQAKIPSHYITPSGLSDKELSEIRRVVPNTIGMRYRTSSFVEVEQTLSEDEAGREARRCLRCDLEFTQPAENEANQIGGKVA
jgi:NADH-quinone oxidoreductase subunit F